MPSMDLTLEYRNLLQRWQHELTTQTRIFLRNLNEFESFHKTFEKQLQELHNVRDYFNKVLEHTESILGIRSSKDYFLERLLGIAEAVKGTQKCQNEMKLKVKRTSAIVEGYKAREGKLSSLVSKMKELTAELEGALEQEPALSSGENTNNATEEELDGEELDRFLEETKAGFEDYCNYRKNTENGVFKRNYFRFGELNYAPLDELLTAVDKELFHLWIQEDKTQLKNSEKCTSTGTQTDVNENQENQEACREVLALQRELKSLEGDILREERKPSVGAELGDLKSWRAFSEDSDGGRGAKPTLVTVEPYRQEYRAVPESPYKPSVPQTNTCAPKPLEVICSEISSLSKIDTSQSFNRHHYYLEKLREIIKLMQSQGVKAGEISERNKFVSVLKADSNGDQSWRIAGYGNSPLEAREMSIENLHAYLFSPPFSENPTTDLQKPWGDVMEHEEQGRGDS